MEFLHLARPPYSLHDQATQALHTGLSDAPPASFPPISNSNSKWVTQQMADDARVFAGLSSLDSRNHPQKLLITNKHAFGCIPGQDYCRIGRDIYRLGHDLHALPPRKLRKLLTTFSDGVHVFSCVERVGVSNSADSVWSEDGFDPIQSFLSKKRSWQVCGMNWGGRESVDAISGFLGLPSIYQRPQNSNMWHDENDNHMQDWGSGGDSNGGGHGLGGDGEGHSGFGPEQPGSDKQGIPVMTGQCDDNEDEATLDKVGTDGMDIPTIDAGNMSMQKSPSCNEDVAMARDENCLLDGCDSKNCSTKSYGMLDVSHRFLYIVLEHLRRAASPFNADFKRILDHEQEAMVEGSSSYIPTWQYNANHPFNDMPQGADHGELQADLQDLDVPLMDDDFQRESSGELLEKLRGLTLGKVVQLSPPAEHIQKNPVQAEEEPKHKKDSGSLQGLIDWFDHLAHSVSARRTEDQYRFEKDNHAEDQKLKTLINEAVVSALKQVSDSGDASTAAKQADMETLRRLQREVFSELLKIREKLDQLGSVRSSNGGRNLSGAGKTILKGEVKVGTAVVMLEDSSSRHSRCSLEQAGMQTGVDVRLTFETPFRDKDLLITECIAGQGSTVGEGRSLGGPMSLGKVHYLAHINDNISMSFVPVGAQGMDVTDIVNPMQDQGLTAFSSRGPTHFDHCKGSAVGATWSGSSFAVSAAQYLSGWGNQTFSLGADTRESGPLCLSTLGQFLLQPTECLIFSLSGLNRFWPSPPLPSSTGLHWSEMGPLVIPKIQSSQTSRSTFSSEDSFLSHCNSLSSNWGMLDSEYHLDVPECKGTSLLSVAVASEMEIRKDLSVSAWAQVDMGDVLQDLDKGNFQWAMNVAKTSPNGVDWGASIGSSRPDFWSVSTSEQEMYPGFVGGVGDAYSPQLHMETFVKLNCGKGFTLQPGLLYLWNKHSHTPAFIVRSSWSF